MEEGVGRGRRGAQSGTAHGGPLSPDFAAVEPPCDVDAALARRHDTSLFASASVELGQTRVPAESDLWRRIDRTTSGRVLVFPRYALAVRVAGDDSVVLHAGRVVVPRPGFPFRRVALDRRGELSDWVWLAPDIVEELGLTEDPSWFRALDGPALLAQRATMALARGGGARAPAALESAALELAAAVSPRARAEGSAATPRQSRAVSAAVELIARSPFRALDLATLARAAGLSPAHLCTVFRRVTGRTLREYLRTHRLCLSIDALLERGADLTTLALELGFSSHSHFSARFRAFFRCTPSEARARLRAPAASRREGVC